MKKITSLLLAAVALFAVASNAGAQTAPKILVVDMEKIYNNHYKTIDQQAKLQADGKKVQDQIDAFTKEINGLADEAKDLKEQAKNPALSADAKDKLGNDFQKKVDEWQSKRQEASQYLQQMREAFDQRKNAFKQVLVEEISHVALDIAKRRGATFLIDKSAVSLSQVPILMYSDPAVDITDDVVAEINRNRPVNFATPETSATPATTSSVTAPSSDTPSITVPNIPKG